MRAAKYLLAFSSIGFAGSWNGSSVDPYIFPNNATHKVAVGATSAGTGEKAADKMFSVFGPNGDGIKIGTNTTSDASANLFFYPSSANTNKRNWVLSAYGDQHGDFSIRNSNNNTANPYGTTGTTRFMIDKDGKVGIGTLTPTANLHVGTPSGSWTFKLGGLHPGGGGITMMNGVPSNTSTAANPAQGGFLIFTDQDGVNGSQMRSFDIGVQEYADQWNGGSQLRFLTSDLAPSGTSGTQPSVIRMVIDRKGQVGIGLGATPPAAKLDVNGSTYHRGIVSLGGPPSNDIGLVIHHALGLVGSNQYGLYAAPRFNSAAVGTGNAGTFGVVLEDKTFTQTLSRGVYILNPQKLGTGTTINTNVGLDIADQTSGQTNYAIRTSGTAQSQFGGTVLVNGKVGIANTSPQANLHVGTPSGSWSFKLGGLHSGGGGITMMNGVPSNTSTAANTAEGGFLIFTDQDGVNGSQMRSFDIGVQEYADQWNGGGQLRFLTSDLAPSGNSGTQPSVIRMVIDRKGNVGIGNKFKTTKPTELLEVDGNIKATGSIQALSVLTKVWSIAPDYVFEKDYELKPLADVDRYVRQNKHLPEIPSAKEIAEKGIDLAEMNMKLLKKVEELTLYSIEQNKEISGLKSRLGKIESLAMRLEKGSR